MVVNTSNRLCILVFLSVLFLGINGVNPAWGGTYSGGDGTAGNPYKIANLNDLQKFQDTSDDWDKYFIQTADIDASDTSNWDPDANGMPQGWNPVGAYGSAFEGSYDGGNHSITGLFINRPSKSEIGFFGVSTNTERTNEIFCQNLILTNVDITGKSFVGAIAGVFNYGEIINCSSTGTVKGEKLVGGLIAFIASEASVTDSHSEAAVVASADVNDQYGVGGLVGQISSSSFVSNCYSNGSVSGKNYVGGLIGELDGSSSAVERCFSNSDVSGEKYVGGFVGNFKNGDDINNSYSTGNVTRTIGAETTIGSFCGSNIKNISYSYSTGSVIYERVGNPTDKGFVGINAATAATYTNNFFDKETSNQTTGTGAIAKTTAEMKTQNTFENWIFDADNWGIDVNTNDGYPHLKGVPPPPPPTKVTLSGPATILKNGLGAVTLTTKKFIRQCQ
ncbi:MAG: hypothetical protein HQL31_08795 [Planctomycetes bacterium]|nr:hypothetical protein [Planctomycetota bacterium]